ncbi:hypothetical protein FJZ31_42250 [Candidatus Poribacteria bacterium]|nr:hypothetical protein [Candidatus Poribacteria bacterium]
MREILLRNRNTVRSGVAPQNGTSGCNLASNILYREMTISVIEMKHKLGEIIETLPESNLKVVLDFAIQTFSFPKRKSLIKKKKREGKKAVIKKTSRGIADSTFGIWHDEVDGIEYMDKMRAQWERK